MADGYLLDAKDEVLQKASIEAKESGSILPLLKVEIQCKIKQKLLEKGEDEITFMMSSPPRKRRTDVLYFYLYIVVVLNCFLLI